MNLNSYLDYLVQFIQDCVSRAKAQGVIVGVSGGVDSAVVALLAKRAFPKNYLTVWMPLNSSKLDRQCVEELTQKAHLHQVSVPLEAPFQTLKTALETSEQPIEPFALANIKARLRMTTLYALAQSKNYLVLGTDNADEWYLGYFTKYGDGGVDLVPLIHLLKGEVFMAAKLLGVPRSIINRAPTAGLWEQQTDETEIGFSYAEIDAYLQGEKNNSQLIKRMRELHQKSNHKRRLAIKPKPFVH